MHIDDSGKPQECVKRAKYAKTMNGEKICKIYLLFKINSTFTKVRKEILK